MRLAALWLLLFAVYLVGNEPLGGDEQEYLRIANALGDEIVRSPLGFGFSLLIAPFGESAAAVVLAGIAALGFVLAALLARRIVPEPYASMGAGVAGLSAPAVTQAATLLPAATAGTLLVGAALCATAAPRAPAVFGAAALLAPLPWLDPRLIVPALPIAVALYVWCRRARRATRGLIAVELAAASVVLYVTLNEQLYGGPTPWSALPAGVTATGAESVAEYLERLPRLVTLWVELLPWAPAFALVFHAGWLLWRSREEGLARVVPERADAEAAAGLALTVVGGVVLVAAFLVPAISEQSMAASFPVAGALIAWSLRHAPRVGAVLGVITVAISAYETLAS